MTGKWLKAYRLLLMMFIAVCSVNIVFADKVYRWTDKNGVVHYGDQPKFTDTDKVNVDTSHSNDSSVSQQIKQHNNALKAWETAQKKQAEKELENSGEQGKKKVRCDRARKLQKSYNTAARLYKKDESGKKVMLNKNQKQAAEQEVVKYIAKYCK